MKKIISLFIAGLMVLTLVSCTEHEQTYETTVKHEAAEEKETLPENPKSPVNVTLYCDFSAGSEKAEELELIKTYEVKVKEAEPLYIAKALTELTGLDFTLNNSEYDGKKYIIDWSSDSTLIKGLDDRAQKEEFRFSDADSLRWFMLDTLLRTLREALGTEEIYYTRDNGKTLEIKELSPVSVFPADVPYMGSAFYFHHSDNKGEDFPEIAGTWVLSDDFSGIKTAKIVIDAEGKYTSYFEDGTEQMSGYIDAVSEDGVKHYFMIDEQGNKQDGFYLRDENKIQMSESDAAAEYERQ